MKIKNSTEKLHVLSAAVGIILFCYMAYATVFGPYKTTFVHLALFGLLSFIILFIDSMAVRQNSRIKVALDLSLLLAAAIPLGYFIADFERLINLWGSTYPVSYTHLTLPTKRIV